MTLGVPTLSACHEAPLSTLSPASEHAEHIARVWTLMAWGSMIILAIMVCLTILALRARKVSDNPRRDRWLLLGGGVVFPASVIIALLAYAYAAGPSMPDGRYRVEVTAHRWWWEVRYPEGPDGPRYSTNEIHIPVGVPVEIAVTADDVIHAVWVPRLNGKMDAIPGRINHLVLDAREPGVYEGTCAEYCGEGHALMRLRVIAHEDAALSKALAGLPQERIAP